MHLHSFGPKRRGRLGIPATGSGNAAAAECSWHASRSVLLKGEETMARDSLLPDAEPVRQVDASDAGNQPPGAVLATDDRELIREWAAKRDAHPATGEATPSGPATVDVQDGGAGIRFNFPAAAVFRAISWE